MGATPRPGQLKRAIADLAAIAVIAPIGPVGAAAAGTAAAIILAAVPGRTPPRDLGLAGVCGARTDTDVFFLAFALDADFFLDAILDLDFNLDFALDFDLDFDFLATRSSPKRCTIAPPTLNAVERLSSASDGASSPDGAKRLGKKDSLARRTDSKRRAVGCNRFIAP